MSLYVDRLKRHNQPIKGLLWSPSPLCKREHYRIMAMTRKKVIGLGVIDTDPKPSPVVTVKKPKVVKPKQELLPMFCPVA